MADIVDTTPAFEAFARKAFLESPVIREQLWIEHYEGAHPDVFRAFYDGHGTSEGRDKLLRDLASVRKRVREASPAQHRLIEEVEPLVRDALDRPAEPAPRHVMLVGSLSTDADVGRLDGEVTLFHCLEWFHSEEGMRILVAHEDTHAWHEIVLGTVPPEDDAAWMAFYEGVAIHAARAVVPGRPEDDYFWYGHSGFADWLPWCKEHADELVRRFAAELSSPESGPEAVPGGAVERWFGAGLVEGRWRTGYFVADLLVARLERPLPELVTLSVDDARTALLDLLAKG